MATASLNSNSGNNIMEKDKIMSKLQSQRHRKEKQNKKKNRMWVRRWHEEEEDYHSYRNAVFNYNDEFKTLESALNPLVTEKK